MGPCHPHRRHQGRVSWHAKWRVAVVHHGSPTTSTLTHLRQGLHRRGLIEGNNCIVDAGGVEGRWAQLPGLIKQLLHRRPDVLVAVGGVAALSAQQATSRVPILHAIVLDPLDIGLTASNVSGITTFNSDQAMRHLQLLRQLVPSLRQLAFLTDHDAPKGQDGRNPLESQLRSAAAAHGVELVCAALPGTDADLEDVFDTPQLTHADALMALEVPRVLRRLGAVARLAECHRLPMLSPYGWQDGGVVMRGSALHDAIDPLAEAVAALFCGATVVDLPLRTVRHERLVVHRGRAQRIGLKFPASVLDRVTQCIDDLPSDDVNCQPLPLPSRL